MSAALLGLVHAGLIPGALTPGALTPAMATSTATIGTAESTLFWFVAPLSVIGALGMLLSRKAVHSALWLALTMCSLAILYIAQGAPFLGIVQIVVYTGAVMMLFLFVLMLVGVDSSDSLVETIRGQRAWALVGFGFAFLLLGALGHVAVDNIVGLQGAENAAGGNLQAIAQAIFGRYLFAFEVTSALLITAAMGAMILAHRERVTPKPTQRELSEHRALDLVARCQHRVSTRGTTQSTLRHCCPTAHRLKHPCPGRCRCAGSFASSRPRRVAASPRSSPIPTRSVRSRWRTSMSMQSPTWPMTLTVLTQMAVSRSEPEQLPAAGNRNRNGFETTIAVNGR